jgi:putative aldouronate transport system substrate-binding protein
MSVSKKLIVVLLALAAAAAPVVGCGRGNKTEEDDFRAEILLEGWINQSIPNDPAKNPYKKYIDEKYDIDSVWSNTSAISTEIMKRYTSEKAAKPHVIVFWNRDYTTYEKYYEEGMFVDDYKPYFDAGKLPSYKAVYDGTLHARMKYTDNGRITALTYGEEPDRWQFKIRQDWIDTYAGGVMPATPDQLLAMAMAVKAANNPANPTKFMFTAAGKEDQEMWFGLLEYLQYMYAPREFYVDDNEVKHPIVTGDRQKFLDFMKTIVDEKLIDPNWETQQWQAHKSNIYTNKIGMPYFSAEIVSEAVTMQNGKHSAAETWVNLPMPKDPASPLGGGDNPTPTFNYSVVITKEGAENPVKLEKIFKLLEGWLYDSETYWALRWGVGCDEFDIAGGDKTNEELEYIRDKDGGKTDYLAMYRDENKDSHKLHTYYGMVDYGAAIATKADKVIEYGSNVSRYFDGSYNSGAKYIQLAEETAEYQKNNPNVNYMEMLKLATSTVLTLREMQSKYEMMYIKGTATESYADFVKRWKAAGGDALTAQAKEQFKAAGYIT